MGDNIVEWGKATATVKGNTDDVGTVPERTWHRTCWTAGLRIMHFINVTIASFLSICLVAISPVSQGMHAVQAATNRTHGTTA